MVTFFHLPQDVEDIIISFYIAGDPNAEEIRDLCALTYTFPSIRSEPTRRIFEGLLYTHWYASHNITNLSFSPVKYGNNCVPHEILHHCPNLEELKMHRTRFSSPGAVMLHRRTRMKTLKVGEMIDTEEIDQVIDFRALTVLEDTASFTAELLSEKDDDDSQFTAEALRHVAGMKHVLKACRHTLERLHLGVLHLFVGEYGSLDISEAHSLREISFTCRPDPQADMMVECINPTLKSFQMWQRSPPTVTFIFNHDLALVKRDLEGEDSEWREIIALIVHIARENDLNVSPELVLPSGRSDSMVFNEVFETAFRGESAKHIELGRKVLRVIFQVNQANNE